VCLYDFEAYLCLCVCVWYFPLVAQLVGCACPYVVGRVCVCVVIVVVFVFCSVAVVGVYPYVCYLYLCPCPPTPLSGAAVLWFCSNVCYGALNGVFCE